MKPLPQHVAEAAVRLAPLIHRTPILTSRLLDRHFGCRVHFKCENFQKTGSFKARGALNALLKLREAGALPALTVTVSSGNHAQATAYAGAITGTAVRVFVPADASPIKLRACEAYGAEVVRCADRTAAEAEAAAAVAEGAFFLPPFDHPDIIAGQGTACLELLDDLADPQLIIATCGGGGWLGGTVLAAELRESRAALIGAEPEIADDATRSFRAGHIITLTQTPDTLADGARTRAPGTLNFPILQRLHDFITVSEADIIRHTQMLTQVLKITVEPTSAVASAGLEAYLRRHPLPADADAAVLISGGNLSAETRRAVWSSDVQFI